MAWPVEHRGSLGSSTPCCATAPEAAPSPQGACLSCPGRKGHPPRGPQSWPWPRPPMLLPGLHLNPAVPDPFPLLSCACAPGVHLSICASSGASAANKCVGAAVQQTEGRGEGKAGWGWAPTATAISHSHPSASTTTAIQNQPHLFCTAEHKLNVSNSTAPGPAPPSGAQWGWRRAQAQLHAGGAHGCFCRATPTAQPWDKHRSHHPCPAQTKQHRRTLPGPEDEDKHPEHPRE